MLEFYIMIALLWLLLIIMVVFDIVFDTRWHDCYHKFHTHVVLNNLDSCGKRELWICTKCGYSKYSEHIMSKWLWKLLGRVEK